jgi:fatty acid desaturase
MFMHHAEGNMLGDESTTLPFERDNFKHFLYYWARFFLMGHIHLTRYFWIRGKKKVALTFIFGELAWFTMFTGMATINWAAALVVFLIPMVMMRWLMMSGNFAQHSFVDITDPDNPYRNSTHITNSPYNHKSYNDGYHIIHHIRPSMHWSEMAQYYEDNVDDFIANDAIVFDGIRDNQHVWFLLMTKNYDKLANCLVDHKGRSHDEKVALLKSRVQRTLGERPRFFHLETLEEAKLTSQSVKAAA